jgi:26S proteasome non-ATPase regulatory subunit 9
MSSIDHARNLITRKEEIESELNVQLSILSANSATLHSPQLVDQDGFPRSDIDVYAVRMARVRILQLRNDLKTVMDDIAKALETIYDPTSQATTTTTSTAPQLNGDLTNAEVITLVPFAKVDGVAPGSPAAAAVSHCV